MLERVSLPFCQVLMLDRWDAPPSRYFAAYRAIGAARAVLGHSVVDEFGTISSPVFLAPLPLLGKIYDLGITLGHRRDQEMALDLGWPPLCLGIDRPAPDLPEDWQQRALEAIETGGAEPASEAHDGILMSVRLPSHALDVFDWAGVRVIVVSEPLLPRQLRRICDAGGRDVTVAISVGNRIERGRGEPTQTVRAASESKLKGIVASLDGLDQPAAPR